MSYLDTELARNLGRFVTVMVFPRVSENSDDLRYAERVKYVGKLEGYSISATEVSAFVGGHFIGCIFANQYFELHALEVSNGKRI